MRGGTWSLRRLAGYPARLRWLVQLAACTGAVRSHQPAKSNGIDHSKNLEQRISTDQKPLATRIPRTDRVSPSHRPGAQQPSTYCINPLTCA